ncbi:response regulator [Motilimonas pumila]|uniref:Response regulator n=1 Tax=Motilimonas pumila TaxID=2303987 RepID=A0A418YGV7_9GAMM|nr:response regulator [Motilimonas pumila]RJG49057.1 response regulator [Motilimonas pumila]
MNPLQAPDTIRDLTILVIEDELVFRHQICSFLKQRGALVAEAENGQLGIELLADLQPDIVLCDLNMPVVDGHQVIKHILTHNAETPVVVISARQSMDDIGNALRHGAKDYLLKPIDDWPGLEQLILRLVHGNTNDACVDVLDEQLLAETELAEHLVHFKHSDPASTQLMNDLIPAARYTFSQWVLKVEQQGLSFLPDIYTLDEQYFAFLVVDLSLFKDDSAITAVLIKSLVNEPFRQYQSGESGMMLSPSALLNYLNKQLYHAGLSQMLKAMYVLVDMQSKSIQFANAGFLPAHPAMASPHPGLALGVLETARYEQGTMDLSAPIEFTFESDLLSQLTLTLMHQ